MRYFKSWPIIFFLSHPALQAQRSLEAQQVRALPASDKRWALLIGVDEYEDGDISGLVGAANDSRALKQVLVRTGGFPDSRVIVVATGEAGDRGRPRVDTRFSAADGEWRVAFAFDTKRKAILLVAGDKSGVSEKRFYRELIRKADDHFDVHLARLKRARK